MGAHVYQDQSLLHYLGRIVKANAFRKTDEGQTKAAKLRKVLHKEGQTRPKMQGKSSSYVNEK